MISKSSTVQVRTQLMRMEAVGHRLDGLRLHQIGELMGISPQFASKLIRDAIDEFRKHYRESAEQLVQMELDRLDEMWQGVYPTACTGDHDSVMSCLKIMERRAKLLGLDAPKKLEVTNKLESMSDEELRAEARRVGISVAEPSVN